MSASRQEVADEAKGGRKRSLRLLAPDERRPLWPPASLQHQKNTNPQQHDYFLSLVRCMCLAPPPPPCVDRPTLRGGEGSMEGTHVPAGTQGNVTGKIRDKLFPNAAEQPSATHPPVVNNP